MQSGSPRHSSVIRTHSRKIYVLGQFPKNSNSVSEDRNFSMGGVVVGILLRTLGVAMGAGLAQGSIGTNEPDFGEDQLLCLGQIVLQVPMS